MLYYAEQHVGYATNILDGVAVRITNYLFIAESKSLETVESVYMDLTVENSMNLVCSTDYVQCKDRTR